MGIKYIISAFDPRPDLAILWFGNNDASEEHTDQHVPLPEFIDNYNSIIDHIYSLNPQAHIILITPTICVEDPAKADKNPRFNAKSQLYAQAVRDLGTSRNIPIVDIFDDDFLNTNDKPSNKVIKQDFVSDNLHLNYKGNLKVSNALLDTLNTHYPHLLPTTRSKNQPPNSSARLQMLFPPSDTIKQIQKKHPFPSPQLNEIFQL
jgi:lysophospholipase L1-like esterase